MTLKCIQNEKLSFKQSVSFERTLERNLSQFFHISFYSWPRCKWTTYDVSSVYTEFVNFIANALHCIALHCIALHYFMQWRSVLLTVVTQQGDKSDIVWRYSGFTSYRMYLKPRSVCLLAVSSFLIRCKYSQRAANQFLRWLEKRL